MPPLSSPSKNIMKSIRFSLIALALVSWSSVALAGPGPQHWQTLRTQQQFQQVKAGEQLIYVCNECKTVSDFTVTSTAQAMEHCKEGSAVTCPACKTKVKTTLKRQRNDPPAKSEVVYVNDKGEECLFIAKVAAKQ